MKSDTNPWHWSPEELERGYIAWQAIEHHLSANPDTLSKLYIMLLELGPEEVIKQTITPMEATEEARELYEIAVRFKWYDMQNPDHSRPGVSEFYANKPK